MKFDLAYIDLPWKFKTYSPKGMGRSPKYTLINTENMKKLPIMDIMSKDCVIFSWVTDPFLETAFEIYRCWGVRYKTVGFYWVKTSPVDPAKFPIGNGYYTRANPEQCHILTRGHPPGVADRSLHRLLIAPRLKHSRKPDEAYHRIEKLYPDLSKVELFATRTWPGYVSIGNEIDGLDIFDAIQDLKGAKDGGSTV